MTTTAGTGKLLRPAALWYGRAHCLVPSLGLWPAPPQLGLPVGLGLLLPPRVGPRLDRLGPRFLRPRLLRPPHIAGAIWARLSLQTLTLAGPVLVPRSIGTIPPVGLRRTVRVVRMIRMIRVIRAVRVIGTIRVIRAVRV